MSEKTNLRQADTKVEVVGIVSENRRGMLLYKNKRASMLLY